MRHTELILMWTLHISQCFARPCAKFHFPAVHHETMKLKENTQLTLSFELQKENCAEDDLKNLEIRVTKTDISGSGGATHCTIRHSEGKCIETFDVSDGCKCSSPGKYAFSKNVDRSDSTVWVWSTSGRQAEKKEITFDVEYAANVSGIVLNGFAVSAEYLVDKGTAVDIVCFWENGNPTVKPQMLDAHGNKLQSMENTGQFRYRFSAVDCQDAGLIRCVAPGASQNKTARLLVRCPPQLKLHEKDVHVTAGEIKEIRFDVRSHTTEIIECYLGKVLEINDRLQQCQSARLTGTPPDLTLTVQLDILRKEEEGQWRLNLTNDAGTGHVDFSVQVTETSTYRQQTLVTATRTLRTVPSVTSTYVIVSEKTSHTTSSTVRSVITFDGEAGVRDDEEDSRAGKAVGITFAVLIIVVAGVSVAAFYYFKIRGRPQDRIRSGLYEMIFRRRQNQPASEHIYEEARPVSVLEEEPVPARPTPKPRRKLQDPAVSENRDYLSLVSETADKGEDGERGAAGTSSEPEEP